MEKLEELESTILLSCKKNYDSIAEYGYLATIYRCLRQSPKGLKRLWRIVKEMGRHRGTVKESKRRSHRNTFLKYTLHDPLVKVILLMQLPQLASEGRAEDRASCTQWRLILKYLIDANEKVRKSSQLVFLFFVREKILDGNIVEDYFCPAVNQACAIFADTVDLMCQMAPLVGKELTEKHFLQRFIALCSHEGSSIRESCVRNFSVMCRAVGHETSETLLLPVFVKLCHDPLIYIRSACVDVFVLVACFFPVEKRKNELTAAFSNLLRDCSDNCRSSAYRILGPFMCTFAEHALAEMLASDRFDSEYGLCSENVGAISSHLQLLKTESPYTIFSRSYIKELFPSFSGALSSDSSFSMECGGSENLGSPLGIFFSMFDECNHFGDEELEKVSVSESKHSLFYGLAIDSQNEGDSKEDLEELLDEFNSFNFWRIPPAEIEYSPEIKNGPVLVDSCEKIWNHLEGMGDTTECNLEILELHKSVLLNATSPDSDWNNTQELVDTVHRCMSFILNSDSESPTLCDPAELEVFSELENLPSQSQDVMPEILLAHFISMANQPQTKNVGFLYEERALICASWLPAVALTLGPSNWSRIRDTYKCLSVDFHLKVRRTIAASIHELASILGEEIAGRDLLPVFKDSAVDTHDVAICALQNLAEFFKHLVHEKRLYLLTHILEFVVDGFLAIWNERCREEIVEQLKTSLQLFTPSDCFNFLVPLAMTMLCDRVASVRYKAVEMVSDLIINLREEENFQSLLIDELLQKFAIHSSWRRRQIFVFVCSHVANAKILDSEIFSKLFLDHLFTLSKDLVPNVALCTARCLSVNIIKNKYFSRSSPHFQDIINVLKELETDKDRDVRYFASLYNEDDHEEESLS